MTGSPDTLLVQPPSSLDVPKGILALEWVFIIIQVFGGQICLPLLLLTYFLLPSSSKSGIKTPRSLRRDPAVINFVVSWIISSISYSILLYFKRVDPAFKSLSVSNVNLCLAQACLIPASQALTATTTLVLVVNLWLAIEYDGFKDVQGRKTLITAFLIIPYIVFIAFVIDTYFLGRQPFDFNAGNKVETAVNLALPTIFYCFIATQDDGKVHASPILPSGFTYSFILSGISLMVEFRLIWFIQHEPRRRAFKSPLIRLVIFSVYRISVFTILFTVVQPFAIGIEGQGPTGKFAAFAEIVQAAGPLVAFFICATRTDVLHAWGLKKRKPSAEIMADVDRSRIFGKLPTIIHPFRSRGDNRVVTKTSKASFEFHSRRASLAAEHHIAPMPIAQDPNKVLLSVPKSYNG